MMFLKLEIIADVFLFIYMLSMKTIIIVFPFIV